MMQELWKGARSKPRDVITKPQDRFRLREILYRLYDAEQPVRGCLISLKSLDFVCVIEDADKSPIAI